MVVVKPSVSWVASAQRRGLQDQERCTAAGAGKPSIICLPAPCRAKTDAGGLGDSGQSGFFLPPQSRGWLRGQLYVERDQQLDDGIECRARFTRKRSDEAVAAHPGFAGKPRHALGAHHVADRPGDEKWIFGRQRNIEIFRDRFGIVAVFGGIETVGPRHSSFSLSVVALYKAGLVTLLILRLNA